MKCLQKIVLFAAAVALLMVSDSALQAQGCGCSAGNGVYGIVRRANRRVIPYFAEHPPVYYSYPVPRPYGFSPYALPAGVMPAELQVSPKPQEIINPYFRTEERRSRGRGDNHF